MHPCLFNRRRRVCCLHAAQNGLEFGQFIAGHDGRRQSRRFPFEHQARLDQLERADVQLRGRMDIGGETTT